MSTLATILKNKKKFEDGSLQSLKYKKLKAVRFKDLEESLLSWLKEWPDKDAPMGGTVIQEKAHQFAEQFGYENFRASNGWLESFKKRNELIFRKLWGRSTSVNDGFFKEEETFELSKALTAAEKQKRYRERRKRDTERDRVYKEKERERLKKRSKIGELSTRAQLVQRNKWRKYDKRRRDKEKGLSRPSTPPQRHSLGTQQKGSEMIS
nr:CENP-B homolog protein 2-like isoform X6 [Halyomorpha halys]